VVTISTPWIVRNEERPLKLTKHARDQMALRDISETEVEMVIRSGAWEPQGIGHWLAFALTGGRQVKVAFFETPAALIIKTVMNYGR
jgi:hypothetical protein